MPSGNCFAKLCLSLVVGAFLHCPPLPSAAVFKGRQAKQRVSIFHGLLFFGRCNEPLYRQKWAVLYASAGGFNGRGCAWNVITLSSAGEKVDLSQGLFYMDFGVWVVIRFLE